VNGEVRWFGAAWDGLLFSICTPYLIGGMFLDGLIVLHWTIFCSPGLSSSDICKSPDCMI